MKKIVATFLLCTSISSVYGGRLEDLRRSRTYWEQQGCPLNDHYQTQGTLHLIGLEAQGILSETELQAAGIAFEEHARQQMTKTLNDLERHPHLACSYYEAKHTPLISAQTSSKPNRTRLLSFRQRLKRLFCCCCCPEDLE